MRVRAVLCSGLSLLVVTCVLISGGAAEAEEALRGGHQRLELDRAEHDWGVAGQNERHDTTFTYTNRSEETVTHIRAIGDCGCNMITLSKTELKPGEAGEMKVTFETVLLSGHLTKFIRLISKERAHGEAKIRQKIAILKGLILSPSALRFGDVPRDTLPRRTFRLKWYEGHGKPFQVTGATVPGYDFETAVKPYQDRRDPKWRGWEISVGFKEAPALGMFSAEVAVDTDHPDQARVTVPLSANICSKVWLQSRTLHFGAFEGGKEKKASLRFRPFAPNTTFGKVTAKARKGLVADVDVRADPVHEGYWILSAKVPADAPPGDVAGEVIVLDVDVPGEDPIELAVKAFVRTPKSDKKK